MARGAATRKGPKRQEDPHQYSSLLWDALAKREQEPSAPRALQHTPPRSTPPTHLSVFVPLRPSYRGPAFPLRHSDAAKAKLTDAARLQAVLDVGWVRSLGPRERGQIAGQVEIARSGRRGSLRVQQQHEEGKQETRGRKLSPEGIVAQHYQVARPVISKLVQHANTRPDVASLPRSGRPTVLTPTKQEKLAETFNKHQGLANTRSLAAEPLQGWETTYKGRKRTSPSHQTVSAWVKAQDIHTFSERPPLLNNPTAIEERRVAATTLRGVASFNCDTDESYVVKGHGAKKPCFVPTKTLTRETAPVLQDAAHGHPPKLFLSGIVTRPRFKLLKGNRVELDSVHNGKVALFRIRGVRQRKKRRRGDDKKFIPLEDDPIFENVNMDGVLYRELMTMKGGGLDMIQAYNEAREPRETAKVLTLDIARLEQLRRADPPNVRPVVADEMRTMLQEDGAPGHGYDNRHGGRPTPVHDALEAECSARRVKLIKQPRLSPEMNMLDLGVWNALKSRVAARGAEVPQYTGGNTNEVEAALWAIVKEEWELLPAETLFRIAMMKEVVFEEIAKVEGQEVARVPHVGVRQLFELVSPAQQE